MARSLPAEADAIVSRPHRPAFPPAQQQDGTGQKADRLEQALFRAYEAGANGGLAIRYEKRAHAAEGTFRRLGHYGTAVVIERKLSQLNQALSQDLLVPPSPGTAVKGRRAANDLPKTLLRDSGRFAGRCPIARHVTRRGSGVLFPAFRRGRHDDRLETPSGS